MLVPTFVGVYLQIPDGITINMLAVIGCVYILCVCVLTLLAAW